MNKNYFLQARKECTMLTVLAGISFDDCVQYNIYCRKATNNFSKEIQYLGLYADKCIKAIGKVKKIIKAKLVNGNWITSLYSGTEHVTSGDIKHIDSLRNRGFQLFLCDIGAEEHYYFIIEEFALSNFVKVSNSAMQGTKYFNLHELLETDTLPPINDLVKLINQETW